MDPLFVVLVASLLILLALDLSDCDAGADRKGVDPLRPRQPCSGICKQVGSMAQRR